MLVRLLALLLVVVAILAVWAILRLWRAWTLRRLRAASPFARFIPAGRPAVIAFSTPTCAACRTRQAPALAQLRTELGERVTVQTLSALDHPNLVAQAGILTVPATIVLDAAGSVRHLNLGYADASKLAAQVRAVLS